jgi:hypothetical protein
MVESVVVGFLYILIESALWALVIMRSRKLILPLVSSVALNSSPLCSEFM